MNIRRVGIDLAKQVFQVHGVDGQDKVVLHKKLKREQLLAYFNKLPPCLVGMEACGGSHHWARELQKLGHAVKLIAPQGRKSYKMGGLAAQTLDLSALFALWARRNPPTGCSSKWRITTRKESLHL